MPKLPRVTKCCGCVTDLRAATAIIAVLGIVTSPAVSWAVVRHAYVVRVSCYVTTSETRPDVVDVNLNHILSFGFGANAGLGPSCLGPKRNVTTTIKPPTFILRESEEINAEGSNFVASVRWIGWIVLIVDIIFLGFSIYLLYKLFRPPEKRAACRFMVSCSVAIFFSFIYGMLYVAACMAMGGAFPIFEFVFCIIDVIIWSMWIYFALVVRSFILTYRPGRLFGKSRQDSSEDQIKPIQKSYFEQLIEHFLNYFRFFSDYFWETFNGYYSYFFGYLSPK